ncbi:MAG: sel1 repeat family protein [Clostridia bacterium]|nr:sel1 repeat family protein [Clostridia bacterium]
MITCHRCHTEWDYEELGLSCPSCHVPNRPDAAEAAALFHRAVTHEQDKRYEEAFRRYALLAEAGYPEGEEAYARCYEEGIGTPRDASRAADGYLDAAEHGSVRAAYRLFRLLRARPRLADGRGTAIFWLRAAEGLGSPDAAYALATSGERYGLTEDERLAFLYTAARRGHERATRRLSRLYRRGKLLPRDPAAALWVYNTLPHPHPLRLFVWRLLGVTEPREPAPIVTPDRAAVLHSPGDEAARGGFYTTALRLFLLAVNEGSVEATCRAAAAYREGLGTSVETDTAIALYRRAEEAGSSEAALWLGRIFEKDKKDLAEAERHYVTAAEGGVAEHAYVLADFYLSHDEAGEGVRSAMPWLRAAAGGGCLPAADRLSGIEVLLTETYDRAVEALRAGNVREAFSLYRSAAALGHADSLSNLGYCYQKGLGCTADLHAAATAYREAVAAGSKAACFNLAVCYINGYGIGRDYRAARALLADVDEAYREAADRLLAAMDEVRAEKRAHRLYSAAAAVYHRGDVDGALRLRLEAAKGGSARACYVIGCHFEFGDGVPLDRDKAARWYETAAEGGYAGSRSRLKGGYLREKRRFS